MPWLDALRPVRMVRIAIVAPAGRLREALVEIADLGTVEIETAQAGADREASAGPGAEEAGGDAVRPASSDSARERSVRPAGSGGAAALAGQAAERAGAMAGEGPAPAAVLARAVTDETLAASSRPGLVTGERELRTVAGLAVRHRDAAVLLGWTSEPDLAKLEERLRGVGASVTKLPHPAWEEAPTLVSGPQLSRSFRPLVQTYGTVPYTNIDPALFAGLTYAVMFGMMFGDVGHGLILATIGVYLRRTDRQSLASFRGGSGLVVGAGLAAAAFGVLFGEVFGSTTFIGPLWLAPLDHPTELITAGVILGGVFLALSYVIGVMNRWREGGPLRALYASSGIAGACLYLGAGGLAGGSLAGLAPLTAVGAVVGSIGLVLLFVGFVVASGGGFAGVTEAIVELLDAVIRTIANAVSFARLAAFGMTHAAIGGLVWGATASLWSEGGTAAVGAVTIFVAGNVVSFALEALVAAVQALRLEYYELFSRIFAGEGRPFHPWHLTVVREES